MNPYSVITRIALFLGLILIMSCQNKESNAYSKARTQTSADLPCTDPFPLLDLDAVITSANQIHNRFLLREDLPEEWKTPSICHRITAWEIHADEFEKAPFVDQFLIKERCVREFGLKISSSLSDEKLENLADFISKTDLYPWDSSRLFFSTDQNKWAWLYQKYKKPHEQCKNHYYSTRNGKKEAYDCYFFANFLLLKTINHTINGFYAAIGGDDPCKAFDLIIRYDFEMGKEGDIVVRRELLNPFVLIQDIPVW
ncbi:hypothetical protein [Haliscomenobacter sp.]|uniref:hypothetical protein n=1 Tax=Haliscomenobacter sp. TaxID=2717303 RepID=UPI003593EEE3